jgi:hypothetical protein
MALAMDTHTFKIGDTVKTPHGPGVVEGYEDWWTMVRLAGSKILEPFLEGELSYVTPNNVGMEVRSVPG